MCGGATAGYGLEVEGSVFNEKFKYDGSKRQKYYVRGEDSMGNKYSEHHQTDWKTKPFVPKI